MRLTSFCKLILSCICFFSALLTLNAQTDTANAFPFVRFQYTHLLPSGDYEKTFGNTNAVGGAIGFKTRTNWQFEIEGNFLFGADVKRKDLLSDIINERGDVTDADGELVKLTYDLRGLSFYASVGKVFSLFGNNRNSGILVQAGIGYMQHKIFVDYRDGEVFQLSDNMLKGYDRLHTGLALKQFVGYQYFGNKNLVNFYAGFEFNEAFTKNKREYNYDTRAFDKDQKFDFLYGFRVGWSIPIRQRAAEEYYYY